MSARTSRHICYLKNEPKWGNFILSSNSVILLVVAHFIMYKQVCFLKFDSFSYLSVI